MINQIICGDNVAVMKEWDSDIIDLTVTSPPYDNIRDYKGHSFDFEGVAQQLYRMTKPGGVVVWIVGDQTEEGSESGSSMRQALYFKEIGFKLFDTMIYMKKGFSFPSNNRYHQIWEYMFILSKNNPKSFNPIKDRKNKWIGPWGKHTERRKDGSLIVKERTVKSEEYGMRYNVWEYDTGGLGNSAEDPIAFEHPAIFPLTLARDHIISWSNEGDLVLDPFLGSGTVAKAAIQLKRNYVGIDISQEYCDLARRRIKEVQVELF